ncbi:MAG: apolipoprotein N-acyltransferase [Planctomycetaceae bacterium]|nr:apolipoprotein N-acyltransferase [Planctomycetaceae bacterium]
MEGTSVASRTGAATDSVSAPKKQGRVEMSVAQIIDRAENRRAPFRNGLGLSLLAGLTMWACYPPLDLGFLAWLAPLPWLMLIRLPRPVRGQVLASYLGGLVFMLSALQWMRYGDRLMYIGWIALASYLAAYIPIFIGLSRLAVHRWKFPLLVVAPVVWTGLECFRGWFLTGFGWYYLGHTQYRWVELIQISDLVGAYGVSFVMMLFTAAIALQIPSAWYVRLGLIPGLSRQNEAATLDAHSPRRYLVLATLCLLAVVGYGYGRRAAADFSPGPRVALIQGNFRAALRTPPSEYQDSFLVHNELTGYAVQHQPDLIVWPEGMFRYPLQESAPGMSRADLAEVSPYFPVDSWANTDVQDTLEAMSEKAGAALVIGLGAYVASPTQLDQYNSAQLIRPDRGMQTRYDKLHRVPFGEYIPGAGFPLLASVVPRNFGLSPGKAATLFEYQGWRFAPVICFEDTVPHVTRRIVRSIQRQDESGRPVDFLVNLSNDGWFAGSSEHDQHLITAQFRAVELRMPLVRAANMGISSIIDGDGVVLTPEVFLTKDAVSGEPRPETYREPSGRYRRKLEAVAVHTLPLDSRGSLYLWWGDWFAMTCQLATGGLLLTCLPIFGRRSRAQASSPGEEAGHA